MISPMQFVRRFSGRVGFAVGLGVLSLSMALPAQAFAATTNVDAQKCGVKDVKCVITFGDQRITERLTDLSALDTKVQTLQQKKHIGEDEAEALKNDVSTNKNGLNTLKSKLDAESDAQAARQDVKNIYEQFRIYAVVLPRDEHRLHLDVEKTLDDKLTDMKTKIEARIDKAPADKKDQLNSLYNDYKAQLAAVTPLIDGAKAILPNMTPANFNTNRSVYEGQLNTLKSDEKTIQSDLQKATSDLKQINQTLKKK
ncbi:hypothetical protein KSD_30950 [Ktedonobacter sp. SOSP1-85]|uniref:hypothetical protein n=1 Tax=Ktedonobacter sp. SOSP1-85 TaxID=2778367 RepID=UPI001915469D|nr:hypothetical protein [Ktedonobacter sp. SOSP1-85]GHO75324.1 hypothetical protein KSD_30950 [Ktedonobacter sp. SOSP1-85]